MGIVWVRPRSRCCVSPGVGVAWVRPGSRCCICAQELFVAWVWSGSELHLGCRQEVDVARKRVLHMGVSRKWVGIWVFPGSVWVCPGSRHCI